MTVVRRHYVQQWDYQSPEERCEVRVTRGGKPVTCIQPERISFLEEEVMRWRKAYHIHEWFVQNVQDGRDDQRPHDLSSEHLSDLLQVCNRVLEASKLERGWAPLSAVYEKLFPYGKAGCETGRVIADTTVAKELLPTQQTCHLCGGICVYDEWYLEQIERTRDWIVKTLAEPMGETYDELLYLGR